jgi:hypothetical protein
MELRFGRDLSAVRIHSGSLAAPSADSVHASAYTVGRNVVFGLGQYAPSTDRGRQLIVHELTHVMQQGFHDSLPLSVGPTDDVYEQEADRISAESTLASVDRFVSAPTLQRQDIKKKPPGSTSPSKAPASPAGGPVRGLKTTCDVRPDPRDQLDVLNRGSFRTVGTGVPQRVYKPLPGGSGSRSRTTARHQQHSCLSGIQEMRR